MSQSRRTFLLNAGHTATGSALLAQQVAGAPERRIAPAGPASIYKPSVKAAFVRRKGDYGLRWPGEIWDGEAARKRFKLETLAAAERLGLKLDLRAEPIYSASEADEWVRSAEAEKPDGLFLMMLDRQEHAWPTAVKAAETNIPTVIYAPVGTAFTTNTVSLSGREGVFIASTDDFGQAVYGLKMLRAKAKLREMRFIVIKGNERRDVELQPFGTKLRYVPAASFLEEYNRTPATEEVRQLAASRIKGATKMVGPTEQDVMNGVKSYVVARTFLEREQGDGITMDCLGALGASKVSLPCIAWSTMLDHGIPAACEADIGAAVTHALIQMLFDRPGFQQDPVPDTARGCLIGAHCTCATRLAGFNKPAEPYFLSFHHGKRDAVPVPRWKLGQRVTVASVMLGDSRPPMVISAGAVKENIPVPPAGGCVVSVAIQLDGVTDLLDYPGMHQIFFYGDHKRDLVAYCKLAGIPPKVV
jgi:hypothetical protein